MALQLLSGSHFFENTKVYTQLAFIFLFYFIHSFIHSFIHFGLPWVFVAVRRLSLVAASGGFSLRWLLLLRSTGSRHAQASVVVALRL